MNPRNNVTLIGYYPDPEKMGKSLFYKAGEEGKKSYIRGKVSVRRAFKDKDSSNYKYDYVSYKAFGHNADYLHNYAKSGDLIAIQGEIQVDENYEDKDGNTVYGQPFVMVDNVAIISGQSDESSEKKPSVKPGAVSALQKIRQRRNVVAS